MPNDTPKEPTELIASSATLDVVSRGEYDIQIATAHKYPRSVKTFRDTALQLATLNESIAGECGYALPRKDKNGQVKTIEGASIRFAEIIGSAWGNAHVGTRVIADDGEFITAQAVFHDLERNWKVVEEVQRRVTDSKGRRYSADMIAVTANAARSIAMRNAVLHGIPKALWEDIRLRARAVAAGDQRSLGSKRLEAVKAFATYGISEAQILGTLGRDGVVDITIDDLSTLFGLLTAIKDGDITPEEAFREQASGETVPMPTAKAEPIYEDALGRETVPPGDPARSERPKPPQPAENGAQASAAALDGAVAASFQKVADTVDSEAVELAARANRPPTGELALDAQIASDPMALKRLASKAQKDMLVSVAVKHAGMTEASLDQFLSDKFSFTLATLPQLCVNDALQALTKRNA